MQQCKYVFIYLLKSNQRKVKSFRFAAASFHTMFNTIFNGTNYSEKVSDTKTVECIIRTAAKTFWPQLPVSMFVWTSENSRPNNELFACQRCSKVSHKIHKSHRHKRQERKSTSMAKITGISVCNTNTIIWLRFDTWTHWPLSDVHLPQVVQNSLSSTSCQ